MPTTGPPPTASVAAGASPWPASSAVSDHGIEVGGVDLGALVGCVGTPLVAYDVGELVARCDAAVAAFGPGCVAYASKAFTCVAMARLVHSRGLLVDVASSGELLTVLRAGVPAVAVVAHGNGKGARYLELAVSSGVGCVVLDDEQELASVERLAAARGAATAVRIRVTTGVAAGAHDAVRTGGTASKFGFLERTGEAAAAVAAVRRSPWLHLAGVHAHAGSQVLDAADLAASARAAALFAVTVGADSLVVGGGAGIGYRRGEPGLGFEQWAAAVHEACRSAGWHGPVGVEPGRSIAGPAGVTAYGVRSVKRRGNGVVVAVDGGYGDNLRTALYGSRYDVALLRSPLAEAVAPGRVVGTHCESGDVLVADARLPSDVAAGDVLVVPATGAYGYAMGSTYNRMPRPAVLFLEDGRASVVVRRETDEDLLRLDVTTEGGESL